MVFIYHNRKENIMTVHIWGITNPGDLASKKMDNKLRKRYVDYKYSPNSDNVTRVRIRSFNGLYMVNRVKKRKSR